MTFLNPSEPLKHDDVFQGSGGIPCNLLDYIALCTEAFTPTSHLNRIPTFTLTPSLESFGVDIEQLRAFLTGIRIPALEATNTDLQQAIEAELTLTPNP